MYAGGIILDIGYTIQKVKWLTVTPLYPSGNQKSKMAAFATLASVIDTHAFCHKKGNIAWRN